MIWHFTFDQHQTSLVLRISSWWCSRMQPVHNWAWCPHPPTGPRPSQVVVSVVFWGMHCADTHHSVGGSCLDMPVQRNITLSCTACAAGKCWTSWPWVTWRMFCALRIYISATSTHVYDDDGVTQLCKKCFMKIHLHVKKTIHFM